MDPADRISENEEAVKEATPSFILTLRLLASHFLINAIIKYGFPNQG